MERPADAFRTISEVAEDLDLPQHVLRFWETRFTQIKPLKRGGGRRYYRPDDVELLRAIRHLLYGEGYTIRGVQRILKEQGVKAVMGLVRASSTAGAAARDGEPPPALPSGAAPQEKPTLQARTRSVVAGDPLTSDNIHVLQAALAEISECARILHAARG
jgi:DNA-binding transcriptional MerR regulator